MKGGLGGFMKQAQKMQEDIKKKQEELAGREVIGESGGGMVRIVVNGKHEARRVELDESILDDKEMLEDLIAAAINDATHKVESQLQDQMSDMLGGLNLPPGMKLPF